MQVKLEVCAGSVEDCLLADKLKVERVELNTALSLGGLSASLASLILVKRLTSLEVICMVRPRAGGFVYTEKEAAVMFKEAELLLENGADGIAFGFLNSDFTINDVYTSKMVYLIHSYHKTAVFHRAIDQCTDYHKAIEKLIELKVDRILTSGQKPTALEGKQAIAEIQKMYGEKIEILTGSGINDTTVETIVKECGVKQVHASARGYESDLNNNNVSFAYLPQPHQSEKEICSYDKLQKLLLKIKKL